MSVRDPAEILKRQTGAPIDEQEQKECVSLGVNGRGVNKKDHYSAPYGRIAIVTTIGRSMSLSVVKQT